MLSRRTAARARRATVDPRGADGVNKLPIADGVVVLNLPPGAFCIRHAHRNSMAPLRAAGYPDLAVKKKKRRRHNLCSQTKS